MKRYLNTSASIAIMATFLATGAQASDLFNGSAKDAPSDVVSYKAPSWTGLWVGAVGGLSFYNTELGYNSTKHELNDGVWEPSDYLRYNQDLDIDGLGAEGLFGEIQAGYDKQIGSKFVVGIFGGLNLSDAEFNASYTSYDHQQGEWVPETASISTGYEWGGVVGGRLGVLKSSDTMFYVAGGWAFAQLGDTDVRFGDVTASIDGPDLNGWFGEVGMEHRLSENLYLTLAGRYTDYGAETLWSNTAPTNQAETHEVRETIEIDTDNLAVMVGIKAKLGLGN